MKLNEYLEKNVENNHEVFNRRFSKPYHNYNKFISDNISMTDFVSKYGLPEECDIKFVNEYKTDVPDKGKNTCSAWFDSELLIFSKNRNVHNEIKLAFLKNNKIENNEVKTNKIQINTITDLYRIEDKKFIHNYRKGYFKGIKFVGTLKELTDTLEFSDVSQLKLFDISDYKNGDYVVEVYHKYSDNKVFIWFDREKTISNDCYIYIQGFNINSIEDIRRIEDYRFESSPSGYLYFKGSYDDLDKLLLIELDKKEKFYIESDADENYVTITDRYTEEFIEIYFNSEVKSKDKEKNYNDNRILIETAHDFEKLKEMYNFFEFNNKYDHRSLNFKGNLKELFNTIKISKNIKLCHLKYNSNICLRLCYAYPEDIYDSTKYSFICIKQKTDCNEIDYLEEIIRKHNND